jgi:hypothetical protein
LNIGLIDADLLDNGTRHPNLALMKISGFHKEQNNDVSLLLDYNNVKDYDKVYISKVFDFTKIPIDLSKYKNVKKGGTGFYWTNAPDLPDEIEHRKPDYDLYNEYIKLEILNSQKNKKPKTIKDFKDYTDYSIGFATRGCFRKCDFCVNKKYDKAFRHAKVSEFYDPNKKYIYLLDDNIFAYNQWIEVFNELSEINKPFQFRQGIDLRLMTDKKAQILSSSKWQGDFIFAFDNIADRNLIEEKLVLWKKHCHKTTKLYVFCGYGYSSYSEDIENTFERIRILMSYGCLSYIMRHKDYENSPYRGTYINLARWCNQPSFYKKKNYREFCWANGENSSTVKYMLEFEKDCPEIAKKYYDIRFEDLNMYK